ncbi:MAG: hypothetical protein KKB70_10925 [Proteobacteria bacterium]|nr:hypothetical protein [Pseudomonadota bacterium]MBU1610575.1 hypothetical protein [Pseudomonadota bacterium]
MQRIRPFITPMVTFFLAAPWPNLTGVGSLVTSVLLWHLAANFRADGHLLQGHVLLFPTLGWAALAAICWLDAFARHRDCRRIAAMLDKYGFQARLFDLVSSSRCQRDAALHAASTTGHLSAARAHFHALGYRWYHLLPDPVIDNPFNFFNIHFLRQAFLPGKRARNES